MKLKKTKTKNNKSIVSKAEQLRKIYAKNEDDNLLDSLDVLILENLPALNFPVHNEEEFCIHYAKAIFGEGFVPDVHGMGTTCLIAFKIAAAYIRGGQDDDQTGTRSLLAAAAISCAVAQKANGDSPKV
jgi:hypothetical protein